MKDFMGIGRFIDDGYQAHVTAWAKFKCWFFGHKWAPQFLYSDSYDTDEFCMRCHKNVRLITYPKDSRLHW